ncbi:MAG: ATP-binding protein [bacterium]|nr:ATP-binding protein [bacterium]
MYKRMQFDTVLKRLKEPRQFIQVLAGPRQTGKTTLILQVLDEIGIPFHYSSADDVPNYSRTWIQQQWETARLKSSTAENKNDFVLVLDEIQKINNWTETVKKMWDEDGRKKIPIKLVLLGSATLLLKQGLEESLGGRFEIIHVLHWPYREMKDAFGFSLDQYIYFGGYPGAATLIQDEERWRNYVVNALIETTISKDILMMKRIDKPALLRQLFDVGALYSGQILSFNKMLGQLQDAGNSTTLSHYLQLLEGAGMLAGINKYAGQVVRKKTSSPKFQVLDNALLTSQTGRTFLESRQDPLAWGRLVESSIGTYLLSASKGKNINVYYWRQKDKEVDFVLEKAGKITALEVKSNLKKQRLHGIEAFMAAFPGARPLLVGENGIPPADFLQLDLDTLFSDRDQR